MKRKREGTKPAKPRAPSTVPLAPLPPKPPASFECDAGTFDWKYDSSEDGSSVVTDVKSAVSNPAKGILRLKLVGTAGESWEILFRHTSGQWVAEGRYAGTGWQATFSEIAIVVDEEAASGSGRFVEAWEGNEPEAGRFEFTTDVEVRGDAHAAAPTETSAHAQAPTTPATKPAPQVAVKEPAARVVAASSAPQQKLDDQARKSESSPAAGKRVPAPPKDASRASWEPLLRSMLPAPVVRRGGMLVGGDPCQVAVRITERQIAVAECATEWQGAHTPEFKPGEWKAFPVTAKPQQVAREIIKIRARRLATFRWCPECWTFKAPEHMCDDVCQECAEDQAVVF